MDSQQVQDMITNALRDYATSAEVQEHEDAVVAQLELFETEMVEKLEVVVDDLQHKNQVMYGYNVFLGVVVGAVLIKYLLDRF